MSIEEGRTLRRRDVMRGGALAMGMLTFGPGFWRDVLAAEPAQPGPGPYGGLLAPDANGLALPPGFSSRLVARAGEPVAGTAYPFPVMPDGQGTFPTPDGGWILVTNSETRDRGTGGASAIRFGADGRGVSATRILGGTTWNCAGGRTPWGTWMSCEEVADGRVWECDPTGTQPAVARPAMGRFKHEALAVDPVGQRLYLSEDEHGDAGFYRFTPAAYPDCSAGVLEIALVEADGSVRFLPVPDPAASDEPTRDQVRGSARFDRGEGMWFDSGTVYLVTSNDNRIHAYDTRTGRIEVLYDAARVTDPSLRNVDGVMASPSGDLYVSEDGGGASGAEIGLVTPSRTVSTFAQLAGDHLRGSDVSGLCFDPTGTRLYLSAQTAWGSGAVFEVTGSFRLPPARAPSAQAPAAPFLAPRGRRRRARGPALGLEAPRRMSVASLRRSGLAISATLDEPAVLTATLRGPARGRRAGPALARLRKRVRRRGPVTIRLRLSRRAARTVRRGAALTLELALVGRSGHRVVVRQRVRVVRRAARRG